MNLAEDLSAQQLKAFGAVRVVTLAFEPFRGIALVNAPQRNVSLPAIAVNRAVPLGVATNVDPIVKRNDQLLQSLEAIGVDT